MPPSGAEADGRSAALEADLVLGGGGVRGVAHAGATSYLEERGYAFHRVAGSSAGSVAASLVLHNGVYAGDYVRAWVHVTLRRETGVERFGQLRIEDGRDDLGRIAPTAWSSSPRTYAAASSSACPGTTASTGWTPTTSW